MSCGRVKGPHDVSLAQAKFHFERAARLSRGKLLIVPLLEAQYDAIQLQDRIILSHYYSTFYRHPRRSCQSRIS
jgi:hypothetical protein